MRQKTQRTLASATAATGEAPSAPARGPESRQAGRVIERQADTERLMEEVCERENLKRALQRVRSNKGSPGIDGMTVDELPGYLREHWPAIRQQLPMHRPSDHRGRRLFRANLATPVHVSASKLPSAHLASAGPPGGDSTPGTLKAVQVSLVEPVAYLHCELS